jgi:hypothetical protein
MIQWGSQSSSSSYTAHSTKTTRRQRMHSSIRSNMGTHKTLKYSFTGKDLLKTFIKAMLGTTPDIDRAIPISLGTDRVLEITQAIP